MAEEEHVKESKRFVLYPLVNREVWDEYKTQEASFWTAEEMTLVDDVKHYRQKLNDGERLLLSRVLGFFASSDTIVAENIETNFIEECMKRGWLEATIAYQFQTMMENIHSEAYSEMIEQLHPDRAERDALFNSIHTVPSIKAKAEWCLKWMGKGGRFDQLPDDMRKIISDVAESSPQTEALAKLLGWMDHKPPTFGERLVAFVCVEAIFFSTSFAVIFWFKKRGLMPGITFANELIIRDESSHSQFGVVLFHLLGDMARAGHELGEIVPKERILEIVKSCLELEQAFVKDSLPIAMAGINEAKMSRYSEYIADRVLLDLGCERHYYKGNNIKNPLEWMESIGLSHKTNFFEQRVSSYSRRGVKPVAGDKDKKSNTYQTDADF